MGGLIAIPKSKVHTVFKASAETVNNSNVLQNDDELLYPIGANQKKSFIAFIKLDIKSASDFRYSFTAPAGATGSFGSNIGSPPNEGALGDTETQLSGANITTLLVFFGFVLNGATPGNLQFQWAQNTAVAEDTIVNAGSCLVVFDE